MADQALPGREVGFLGLRLLANGVFERPQLAFGQYNQERLEHHDGLPQARIQVVVVRVHLSPHFLGMRRVSYGEVIGGVAKSLGKILYHFLQSAYFMKELQSLGKQHVVEQGAHARRSLGSCSLKVRRIEWRGVGRSEEHTSELQSQSNLVCRLLLEKKNNRQPRQLSCLTRLPHLSDC